MFYREGERTDFLHKMNFYGLLFAIANIIPGFPPQPQILFFTENIFNSGVYIPLPNNRGQCFMKKSTIIVRPSQAAGNNGPTRTIKNYRDHEKHDFNNPAHCGILLLWVCF
jgi:hypothetical protein